jgi:hypothetical protein
MATKKQIEANRRNAALSQGPTTDSGRARSRLNATKHGMAAELTSAETITSSAFIERRKMSGDTNVDPPNDTIADPFVQYPTPSKSSAKCL